MGAQLRRLSTGFPREHAKQYSELVCFLKMFSQYPLAQDNLEHAEEGRQVSVQ